MRCRFTFLFLFISIIAYSQSIAERYFKIGKLIPSESVAKWGMIGLEPDHFKEFSRKQQLSVEDSLFLAGHTAVDAVEAIGNMVTDSIQIVLISEHHKGLRTRAFNSQLIQMLADKGFNKLFVEALSYSDPMLNDRGYPIYASGFFTREPFFAETLRLAIAVGYTVLPYEARSSQYEINTSKVKRELRSEMKRIASSGKRVNQEQYDLELHPSHLEMSVRDYSQYKNIMRMLKKGEGCVILCGHGHGLLEPYGGWRALGWWIKESGVPLISIDNSDSAEQSDYDLLKYSQLMVEKRPFLAIDSTRQFVTDSRYQPYTGKHVSGFRHANTIYPLNDWKGGEWQAMDSLKTMTTIDLSNHAFDSPFVIYTFLETEFADDEAVPTSATFFREEVDQVDLYLRKEKEFIFLWDGKRKIELHTGIQK